MDSHDQEAPDEVQDQPTPDVDEAPEPASDKADQPEFFDEKFDPASLSDELLPAYQQMRKAFTEKTQSVAEQRKEIEQEQQLIKALRSTDPDLQAQALKALGYDLDQPEEEEPEEFDDPYESRIAAIEQALEQQAKTTQQNEFEQALDSYLDDQVLELQTSTGREFDEDELEALYAQAYARPDTDGVPDVRGAYEFLYTRVLPKEKKRWVTSKQADQPGQGQSGSPKRHLSTRDQMAEIIAAEVD